MFPILASLLYYGSEREREREKEKMGFGFLERLHGTVRNLLSFSKYGFSDANWIFRMFTGSPLQSSFFFFSLPSGF